MVGTRREMLLLQMAQRGLNLDPEKAVLVMVPLTIAVAAIHLGYTGAEPLAGVASLLVLGAMLVFSLVAQPWWGTGLLMGLAQVAGAQVGARLAVRVGAKVIRPLLVVVSLALWRWFRRKRWI